MPTTTAPTYCPACGADEPPGLPIHADELGPYGICPTCDGSHDCDTESPDLDAPHLLPEDFAV